MPDRATETASAALILARIRREEAERRAAQPPVAHVRTTRYTVTCVPPDTAPDAHVWAISVEEQRDGKWIANHMGSWLTADGHWEIGYSGAYPTCAHDLETAMRLAKEVAPYILINGLTVADALTRSKEQ